MKRISRRNNAKILGMAVVGIVIISLIIIFSAKVVSSAQAYTALENYYAELERDYKYAVRDYMNDNGYTNAGITVTRIVDAEGNREYTVKIHHDKLDRLDDEKRELVMDEVAELGFNDDICSFNAVIIK